MNSQELEKLRAQIAASAAAVAKAAQPFLAAHHKLLAHMEPTLQSQRSVAEALTPSLHVIEQAQEHFTQVLRPVIVRFNEMQARLAPVFEQLAKAFHDLPPRQQRALELLASDGWYLDPNLGFNELFDIAYLFAEGHTDKARVLLCDHFDSRAQSIEAELVGRFSDRANLIKAAMRAHRGGEYALSIPVFLAQADGICGQLIGVQLYARRDGKPLIGARLKLEDRAPFVASLLYPLATPMPISAGVSERASLGDLLNRHAVLHGEAVDYDTHANSCRALSLLAYVSWILGEIDEQGAV